MSIGHLRNRIAKAIGSRRSLLPPLALAVLVLAACTPSSPEDDGGQSGEPTAEEALEEPAAQVSQLEALLERLGEPPLAGNCAPGATTYRISRLEWERGAAAVRVFSSADGEGYRSVYSAALGQSISSDGWLDERTWDRVETEFRTSGFWNIESEEFADEFFRGDIMFVEACKDGTYHYLRSEARHHWLSRMVTLLSRIGKLQWLETGRRDHG